MKTSLKKRVMRSEGTIIQRNISNGIEASSGIWMRDYESFWIWMEIRDDVYTDATFLYIYLPRTTSLWKSLRTTMLCHPLGRDEYCEPCKRCRIPNQGMDQTTNIYT